jgi:hypothetical protein
VIDYGADPTGKADSSSAFSQAIEAAWAIGRKNGFNFSYGPDLGGIVIDLVGGQYLLDSPVVWPNQAGGNLVMQHGSVHASAAFPMGRYLFELDQVPPPAPSDYEDALALSDACLYGDPSSSACLQGRPAAATSSAASGPLRGTATGYDDITFRSVLFDSNLRGGGVKLLNALRVYFDGCYFIGYAYDSAGLWTTEAGGAVYVAQSWFSGFDWPDTRCETNKTDVGLAMLIEFPDSMADEVIIACSRGGIIDHSGAFVAQSVHVFGVANEGGYGYFSINSTNLASRLIAPYVDWSRIFIAAGASLSIEQGFFLGCPAVETEETHPFILINATQDPRDSVEIAGVSIRSSQFHGLACYQGNKQPKAIETRGAGSRIVTARDSVMDDNVFFGLTPATSRPRFSMFGLAKSNFTKDLNETLAFPVTGGLAFSAFETTLFSAKQYRGDKDVQGRIAQTDSPTAISVVFESPINGSVSILADQSSYSATGDHAN